MALEFRSGVWYWRKMVNGVQFNRSTKTDDKKLAEQLVKKWEHEAVQTVVYEKERPVTVYEAIKEFLEERKHTPGYRSARVHLGHWKDALPNVLMKSLQQHQVQAVVTKRIKGGAAHNTIAVFITYWNALINYCASKKLSPGPKLERVKQKRTRLRIISEAEEAALLAATCPNAKYPGKNRLRDEMRQDNQDMLICLLHLGARLSEATNLRWSDIDFEHNTVLVRRVKRGDDCLLLMTKALRVVMERRYKTRIDNNVFPTKADHPISMQWFNDMVKRAGVDVEAGKITSHTFRHSCATRLLRAGTFLDHELPARRVPNPDQGNRIMHGIDAVRKFLRLWPFVIAKDQCHRGIEALKNYSRKFNRASGTFGSEADHNEWSHGADAFRYAVLSIKDDDLGRSIERATQRRFNQMTNRGQVNTSRMTLDEAFAARDRELSKLVQRFGADFRDLVGCLILVVHLNNLVALK